ncbi:MAG: hypothetical protein ACKN9D_01090 [Actinomycetales bacterium]
MSEQAASPEPTQPAKLGNPWRTATVVVASIGAGLTAITGLAGFGIGLAAGQATQSDHAQHLMMAGPGFNGPGFDGPGFDGPGFDGRHHGDHRDEMNRR